MAEVWKPQAREVYKEWISSIMIEASDELTSWEVNFITSIEEQLSYRDLSQAQAETLEKIYVKRTK